jgi:uncharacterized membrane protein YtjA (UPF0391 family)
MIKLAFGFLLIALVAGLLGFSGAAGAATNIAQFLFVAALLFFAVLIALGFTIFKKLT